MDGLQMLSQLQDTSPFNLSGLLPTVVVNNATKFTPLLLVSVAIALVRTYRCSSPSEVDILATAQPRKFEYFHNYSPQHHPL